MRLSDNFTAYDTIIAGAGNNIIDAGGGFGNIIWTGAGADTVVRSWRFEHQTTIKDFTPGEDELDISVLSVTSFADLAPYLGTYGEGVRLITRWDGDAENFQFEGLQVGNLSADDFEFDTDIAARTITLLSGISTTTTSAPARAATACSTSPRARTSWSSRRVRAASTTSTSA